MPIFKKKNENFFKKWSPEMAYILGFFCADGAMTINPRGSCYIEFYTTEHGLLEKVRDAFDSNHRIAELVRKNKKWKKAYRLQIGSKIIFDDLLKLGLTPLKAKRMMLPVVPRKYFRHFVRGFFDGDGNVWEGYSRKSDRKHPSHLLFARFTSASKQFLSELAMRLKKEAGLRGKSNVTFIGRAYRLSYSIHDSIRLHDFMYKSCGRFFFQRKKVIFEKFVVGP